MVRADAFNGMAGDVDFVTGTQFGDEDVGVDGCDWAGGGGEAVDLLADGFEGEVVCVNCASEDDLSAVHLMYVDLRKEDILFVFS